ncbi:hypothetical protein A1O1_06218 [Capronia coronata CBS 617.96]|uniref:Uncharacterized protein n=1 Tax=Capronia coronata CBS 617.96 TaxID=1182541 RepID=W9YUA6_9EURO|nr:uncharacterized protein A1O1_06218 [Capronia coronata CBS 617.96]EXJ85849.1 hypothetical protein A1O1_06218 [Capronia coronata CBS 617.96]
MTPNILKSHTDTSKFIGQKPPTKENDPNNNNYQNYNPAPKSDSSNMPTDASNRSGQALDAGASAGNQALNAETSLPENASKQGVAPALSSQGAIGSHFTEHGAIGGTAQKIGGPLDKEGIIGKHFKGDGTLGGTVNKIVGGEQK